MPRPLFGHTIQLTSQDAPLRLHTFTTSETIPATVDLAIGDTTLGNVTLTLPPTESRRGASIIIYKAAAANNLIVQRSGGNFIGFGGAVTSVTLAVQDSALWLIASGGNYWLRII